MRQARMVEMASMLNVQAGGQGGRVLVIMVQLVADDAIDRPRAGLEKKRSGQDKRPTTKRTTWAGGGEVKRTAGVEAVGWRVVGKIVNVRNRLG